MSHAPKMWMVTLLARLNAARRSGDTALSAELERRLEEADRRRGWTRQGGFQRPPPVRRAARRER